MTKLKPEAKGKTMNYFVCTYGNFPEQKELEIRAKKEGVYLLHQYARYPSAIDEVRAGDVLLLNVRGKGIVAYAYAAEGVKHIEAADEWNYVLKTRDGWHEGNLRQCWSPYGIAWATLRGGQFSLVKKVESTWAIGVFDEMGWERPVQQPPNTADVRFRDETPSSVANELMVGVLEIPPVQRGIVWNATRLEVLWDSIMREIPIGTFSIQASKNNEGHWELLDGQQRATAIMSAYRPFPPEPTSVESQDDPNDAQKNAMLAPVVWIDLMPEKMYGRKYVFRVTTGSQPWGYCLTDDESSNRTIEEKDKRNICQKYDWHNKSTTALLASKVKPYPCELVPYKAGCPIPFSIILKCCKEQKAQNEKARNPSLDEFIRFCDKERAQGICIEGLRPWNWFEGEDGLCDKVRSSRVKVEEEWDNLVKRVYGLDEYLILQVNARSVDDVGTYFRRIGRGGVTPSQEEMNYSMLKAKLPSLKRSMELVAAKGWASPSRMAMLALRTWQERMPGVSGSIETLVNTICSNAEWMESFTAYTSAESGDTPSFQKDLRTLDEALGIDRGGLLPWHRMVLCTRSNGEICRYLLRLIVTNRIEADKVNFAGLAAFLLYCSDIPERVISHHLNKKSSIHEGIVSAYRDSYWGRALLRRLATPDEIDSLLDKVDCEDWIGVWERIQSDPVWQPIVQTITMGYDSQAAYSVLLFGCRRFMNGVFPDYNSLLPNWSEENCPWDYDHIFPKDMEGIMKKVAPGSERVLHSIGNLAPLPFSLNRSKHDALPTEAYPLANCSEMDEGQQRQLVKYKEGLMLMKSLGEVYDYSNFSHGDLINAREVFIQTIRRFSFLYRNWFENLNIQSVIPQSTGRKKLFDELKAALADGFSVWILSANGQERKMEENPFFSMIDWIASPWMSFGKCINGFLIAYGDDGQGTFATGICKLPNQDKTLTNVTIPEVDEFDRLDKDDYWYCKKKYPTRPEIEAIKADIKKLEAQVMGLDLTKET